MIKIHHLLIVLCLATMASSLFAGGFALSGVGSRATAMGGAFRGLADDSSAMFWNPAGLAFMDENSVSLGGTFIMPSAKWENNGPFYSTIPGFEVKEFEANKALKAFPSLLAVMAKHPKLKYGLGLYAPYGLGSTYDAYMLPGAPYVYEAGFPEDELESNVSVLDVHPSVAYQILPNLSAGVGISVMYGTIDLGKISFNPDLGENYKIMPISSDLSGSGIGFGANMGLMFKPLESLSVGLSGKIPSEIPMEGEAEIYLWRPDNIRAGGKSDIEATLKLPGEFGFGLAYKVKPTWTVSLDYAYTMWDRLDKVLIEMDETIPTLNINETEIVFDWENTSRVSIGTEYLLGCNTVRAGFYIEQSPIPDETLIATLSDIGTRYSFNAGLGRQIGPIGLDLNLQYTMFGEKEVTAQTANNMAGTYNANSISGNIGLSYKF